jgi:hypothetical protein
MSTRKGGKLNGNAPDAACSWHNITSVRLFVKYRRLNNRKNIGIYYAIDLVNLDLQRDFGHFPEEEQELVKIV